MTKTSTIPCAVTARLAVAEAMNGISPNKFITRMNKKLNLPPVKIVPIHRSDGSGDTFLFTSYLSEAARRAARALVAAMPTKVSDTSFADDWTDATAAEEIDRAVESGLVFGAKLYAFGLSAAIAGIGGVLIIFRRPTAVFLPTFSIFESIFVVIYAFIDNFRRSDHSGVAKAGWALLIIVFPLLGALIYILTRPEMSNPPLRPAV